MDKKTRKIKIELLKKGIKQKEIAREADVSNAAVSRTIRGLSRSRKIERIIEKKLGSNFFSGKDLDCKTTINKNRNCAA